MPELTEVTRETFEDQVLKAESPVLVFYNAAWCRSGAEMAETVKAALEEVGDRMPFFSVDTDREDVIVRQQDVRTVPTVHFIVDGKCVEQLRGAVEKLDLLGKVSGVLSSAGSEAKEEDAEDAAPAPADPEA